VVGLQSAPGRTPENVPKASNGSASSESTSDSAENAHTGTENLPASNPSPTLAPVRSLSSLAAEVAKTKPLRPSVQAARTARRA